MAGKALRYASVLVLLGLTLFMAAIAQEPQTSQQKVSIDWQVGPTVGDLGGVAQIKIPEGYQFAGREGALTVLKLTENPPNGEEVGVLVASRQDASWFMMFRYEETGYVKDDDKDSLDSDSMLKSIQEGTEEANKMRKANGWPAFHVTGWEHTPYYDPLTHNLTWAIRGKGDNPVDSGSINHSIRLLGRKGVIKVNLVSTPAQYASSVGEFNSLISGFSYIQGSRYSDFTKGDKIAKYGLTGLIAAGGAGFVLFKFWKPIVAGIVALGAAIKKMFSSIFGSKETKIQPPQPPPQAAAQG